MARHNTRRAPGRSVRKPRVLGNGPEVLEDRTTPTGTIAGSVWADLDGDGLRGPSEPGAAGRTVFLDTNKNGLLDTDERTATTDGNGVYSFTGLAAGTYTVAEVLPSGVQQSYPTAAQTVTLSQSTQTTTNVFDFSEFTSTTDQFVNGPYHKNGFTFDTTTTNTPKFRIFGSGSGAWYDGSAALSSEWAPVTISLKQDTGQPFTIKSIRLGEYGGATAGGTVTFVGNKFGGGTVTQAFSMDGQFGFQTFTFPATFNNLASLTWLSTGSSPNSYHQIDDVTVESSTSTVGDASGVNFGLVQLAAPTVSLGDVTEPEGSGGLRTLNVPVTLSATNPYPVTVYYRTDDASATGGITGPGDFVTAQGSVTIPAGQTTGVIPITVNGDTTWEDDEYFYVRLNAALNAVVGTGSANVTLLNDDVLAADDSYDTFENHPVGASNVFGVLANDKGITNQSLTAELVSAPTPGSLSFASDGSFTYFPKSDFIGSDSFTYKALSGGASATATATIRIHGTTRPTLSAPAALTFDEDTAAVFSPSAGTGISVSDSAIGSNALDLSLSVYSGTLTLPQLNGLTVVAGANGSNRVTVRGTLDALNAALDGLAYQPPPNYFGNNYALSLVVSDGAGDGDQGSVAFTINPVNDAPVNNIPAATVTTNEDTAVTVPKPTVTDVDNGYGGNNAGVHVTFGVPSNTGTLSLTTNANSGLTVTGSGTAHVTVDGTVSGFDTGLTSLVYSPAANFNGTVPLTMTTGDKGNYGAGGELFDTDTITITVNPVNDAPVAVADSYTTAEDTPLTVAGPGVLANDTDADGDALTAVAVTPTPHGDFVLFSDGGFNYRPNANFNGTDTFTYRANDGTASGNVTTVTITVTPVNDAPVAVNDSYTVAEDGVLSVGAPVTAANNMVVRYTFDEAASGTTPALDSGTGPASNGTFNGAATRSSPGVGGSTGALDLRAGAGYVDGGDADEVDNLSGMTVTLWVNLSANPTAGDRLVGDTPGFFSNPPAGTRGWYLNIDNSYTGGTATAGSFAVSGWLSNSGGASGIVSQGVYNANNKWAFIAFTVNPNDPATAAGTTAVSLYATDPTTGTVFLTNKGVGYPALSGLNTADLTVGGTPYETSEKTPPGMIDDVRIYNRTLTQQELDNVRKEGAGLARAGVLNNDSDADNDPLTATVASGPSHGTLALDSTGKLTYTPNANYNGTDSFTYKANDGTADSNVATVTINVTPVNDAPVAAPDSYATNEDTALTVAAAGVLANDSDVDGDALAAVLVSGPSHGTLALKADGSFTYTPGANFNGSDSFTYKANDGQTDGNTTTVSITVSAVNDAPVAANDSFTTDEDTTLTVAAPGVLANDADVDGDSLAAVLIAGPSHGSLALNADGGFTYTPSANYNGSDSFTYKADDAQVESGSATVTITVNAVNDAPVAVNDSYATDEDTALSVSAAGTLGNDTDVDGNPLTAVLVSGPSHGSLSFNANGSFTYTPNANYNGTDSFTYKANDGSADSNVATVRLTVTPVNDPPVAANDSYTTDEDTALNVPAAGVLANDSDVDGDALTAALVSGPSHGTLTLNANGSFTYTPGANFNGTDSFTYTAGDGQAQSAAATVTLTVNAVNDAPTAASDSYTTNEDVALNVAAAGVLGNDSDVDSPTLTAVLVSGPSHGTLTLNANGSFTYTPGANYNGSDSFTYKANDGTADSNVVTVGITVNAVNDAPVANAGPDQTVNEPATVAFDASGSSDVDGDALTYAWNFGDGTTGSGLKPTHTYADSGPYTVTLTVNDGHGGTGTDTMKVTVRDLAPTAGINGPASGVRGQSRTFTLTAADPSPVDQGAAFGYRVDWGDGTTDSASGPGGGTAVAHTFTAAGAYTVRVWATDKDGLEGPSTSFAYAAAAVQLQGNDLVVGGTTAADQIVITATATANAVQVAINGANQGTFTAPGQIVVFGQAGDDTVSFAKVKVKGTTYGVAEALLLFGDAGNDTLDARNATGPAVIVGGAGNDTLYAGPGRSILVGGAGADTLRGGGTDDILIGGVTDYDDDLIALAALRAEWARGDATYATRQAHLLGPTGGLNGTYFLSPTRVHDDGGALDNLFGNGGQDWFFAASTDKPNDRQSNETVTGL